MAVWWVSHAMRLRREECCDDVAVALTEDRADYVRALLTLDQQRHRSTSPAMAADGGSLLCRVRRLTGKPRPKTTTGATLPIILLILGSTLVGVRVRAVSSAESTQQAASDEISTDAVPVAQDKELESSEPWYGFRSAGSPAEDEAFIRLCVDALDIARRRMLSVEDYTPWQIMENLHGVGRDFRIRRDGEPVSGLLWISAGQKFEGENWFATTEYGGRAHPYTSPYAFQLQPNQWLAYLAMANVDKRHVIQTLGGKITVEQLVRHAKKTITEDSDATWALSALSHYLGGEEEWKNADGETWNLERLVGVQIQRPLSREPGQGTFALIALAKARQLRLLAGGKLAANVMAGNGWPEPWKTADTLIQSHIELARRFQNEDGSLSSNYFRGKKTEVELNRFLNSGYVLEFLANVVDNDDLSAPWLRRAVEATARRIVAGKDDPVTCGPYFHATAAIRLYLQRRTDVYSAQLRCRPKAVDVDLLNEMRTQYEDDLMWLAPYPELGRVPTDYGPDYPSRLFLQLAAHPPAQAEVNLPNNTKLVLGRLHRLFERGIVSLGRHGTGVYDRNFWGQATLTAKELLSNEQIERFNQLLLQRFEYRGIEFTQQRGGQRGVFHRDKLMEDLIKAEPDVSELAREILAQKRIRETTHLFAIREELMNRKKRLEANEVPSSEDAERLNQLFSQYLESREIDFTRRPGDPLGIRHRDNYLEHLVKEEPNVPKEVHTLRVDKMIWDKARAFSSEEELTELKKRRGAKAAISLP